MMSSSMASRNDPKVTLGKQAGSSDRNSLDSPSSDNYTVQDLLEHPFDGSSLCFFDTTKSLPSTVASHDLGKKLACKFVQEEILLLSGVKFVQIVVSGAPHPIDFCLQPDVTIESTITKRLLETLERDIFSIASAWTYSNVKLYFSLPSDQLKGDKETIHRLRSFRITSSLLYYRQEPKSVMIDCRKERREVSNADMARQGNQAPHPRDSPYVIAQGLAGGLSPDIRLWDSNQIISEIETLQSICYRTFTARRLEWQGDFVRVSNGTGARSNNPDVRLTALVRPFGMPGARCIVTIQPDGHVSSMSRFCGRFAPIPSAASPMMSPGSKIARAPDSDSEPESVQDEWQRAAGSTFDPDVTGNTSTSLDDADDYGTTDFLEHPDDGSNVILYQFSLYKGSGTGDLAVRAALARKFVLEEVLSLPHGKKWVDWYTAAGQSDRGSIRIEVGDTIDSPHVTRLLAMFTERLFVVPTGFSDRGIEVFHTLATDMAPPKAKGLPVYRVRSFGVSPDLWYHRRLPYRARFDHNERLVESEEAVQLLPKYKSKRSKDAHLGEFIAGFASQEEAKARWYDPNSGHPRVSRYMIFEGLAGGLVPSLFLGRTTRQDRYDDQVDEGEEHEINFVEICQETFDGVTDMQWIRVSKDAGDKPSLRDRRLTRLMQKGLSPHFMLTRWPAIEGEPVLEAEQRFAGRFGCIPAGTSYLNMGQVENKLPDRKQARSEFARGRGRGHRGRGRGRGRGGKRA